MVNVGPARAVGDGRVLTEAPVNAPERATSYEIRVLGTLDARWSTWFAGLDVSSSAIGETTLTGPLRDQAELHGIFARVRDLGLPLIAVRRLDCGPILDHGRDQTELGAELVVDRRPSHAGRGGDGVDGEAG